MGKRYNTYGPPQALSRFTPSPPSNRHRSCASSTSGSIRPITSPDAVLNRDLALPVDSSLGRIQGAGGKPISLIPDTVEAVRLEEPVLEDSSCLLALPLPLVSLRKSVTVRLPIVSALELGARAVLDPALLC